MEKVNLSNTIPVGILLAAVRLQIAIERRDASAKKSAPK